MGSAQRLLVLKVPGAVLVVPTDYGRSHWLKHLMRGSPRVKAMQLGRAVGAPTGAYLHSSGQLIFSVPKLVQQNGLDVAGPPAQWGHAQCSRQSNGVGWQ